MPFIFVCICDGGLISFSLTRRCAGPETIAALKDGQEVVIKRKLHRGHLVASAAAGKISFIKSEDCGRPSCCYSIFE